MHRSIRKFKLKSSGKINDLLGFATYLGKGKAAESVIVYCPDDQGNSIYVRDSSDFDEFFEPVVE